MRYQVTVGDRTLDLTLDGSNITLDGEDADVRVERLGPNRVLLVRDGRPYALTLEPQADGTTRVTHRGRALTARVKDERQLLLERFGVESGGGQAARELHAPMPGLVLSVAVEAGQAVSAGEGVVVLEAMKMENELKAPHDTTVEAVHVQAGEPVAKGALLVTFAE